MVITPTMAAIATKAIGPLMTSVAKATSGSLRSTFTNWSNEKQIRDAAKRLLRIGVVKTIWSAGKEKYIEDFYYPSKLAGQNAGDPIAAIEDLPEGNLVVEGIVGQGKSMFMRYLACSALRSESPKTRIPIFIELQKISDKTNLKDSIYENLRSLGLQIDDASFGHLAKLGVLVFFLDGFDEIPEACVGGVIQEVESLQVRYPESKIIVSSRPHNHIQNLVGFEVLNLVPLESGDYDGFLRNLKIDSVKRIAVIDAISTSTGSVQEIISTPLMLTLVVWVYESEHEIPATLSQFFEKLFHVVFTRHDSLKAGFTREHHSGLSESKLLTLFEAFCFMTIQDGHGRSLTRSDFNDAFQAAIEFTDGCECGVENFRKDIVRVACLMLEEGIDLTTFLHKSILDYYAAAFVLHCTEELSGMFYQSAYQSYSQWKHVLDFLKSVDTYRYSKFYILPNFKIVQQELSSALLDRSDKRLIALMKKYHLDKDIIFTADGTLMGWQSTMRTTAEPLGKLDNAFIVASSMVVERDKSLVLKVASPFAKNTGFLPGQLQVKLSTLIKERGSEEFWDFISQAEAEINQLISFAQRVVDGQVKKSKIFTRKTQS